MKNIKKIYISGALTITDEKKNIRMTYERIADVAKKYSDIVFVPHIDGADPNTDPDTTPQDVWKMDHDHVVSSDVVIVYGGMPSLGTGAELEIARVSNKKIILWWFKDEKVSRMALGNPGIYKKIEAENEEALIESIKGVLKQYS